MIDTDRDALNGFLEESEESLQGIENDFIALEKDPGNLEIINRIFRPVHSLKGNSGFFGLTNINKFSHRLENLLDFTRKGEILISKEIVDILLQGVEYLQEMLRRVHLDPSDITFRPEEEEFLLRVESFKPQMPEGSLQSVIRFETGLQEFLDCGLNIKDHKIISNLLDQIAKTNIEMEKLISKQKIPAACNIHRDDCRYFLHGQDLSEQVRLVARVANQLSEQKAIDRELLVSFTEVFSAVSALLHGNERAIGPLDELGGMLNFLDDEMVVAHPESNQMIQQAINAIIACFSAEHNSCGSSSKLGEILIEQHLVGKEQIDTALTKQKKIGELLVAEGSITKKELDRALEIQSKRTLDAHLQNAKSGESAKTIRIDQDKLDHFADAVGGLYINLDSLGYLQKLLEKRALSLDLMSRFDHAVHGLDEQLEKLHSAIMHVRRVPVKSLLQRFPKVVRQLSASLGKDIKFTLSGEETVIDKDLLEKIENPLVHILRNSLDHGIETPAERAANNKPAQGNLLLSVTTDENNVYLTIQDDGAGIDPENMRQIAVTKGFVSEEEAGRLPEKELINLIFRPGFSSTEKISDVSGRGVGMDVVLSALKECRGKIDVESKVGIGTSVAITIPLTKTLVTKEAVIVRAGEAAYVIPSEHVTTIVEPGNAIPLLGKGLCIPYGEELYRLIDLTRFYYPGLAAQQPAGTAPNVLICKEFKIGLVVDEVVSHQRIVAKEFTGGYERMKNIEGVEGYTIMGNEEITLIVDVKAVGELAACVPWSHANTS